MEYKLTQIGGFATLLPILLMINYTSLSNKRIINNKNLYTINNGNNNKQRLFY